jgi:hypothetical protein
MTSPGRVANIKVKDFGLATLFSALLIPALLIELAAS